MSTTLNTETNGAQANSVLISLFAWFIRTLAKPGAYAYLAMLGISRDKNTDVYHELDKVLHQEFVTKNGRLNPFRGNLRRPFKITDIDFNVSDALNSLPFVEVTRRNMVRVSGYVTGRSKQVETETRRDKNGAELRDGRRHFCAQCDKWLPFLGLNAEGVRMCCGSPAELLTREVAVSDRYESKIRIPWIIGGSFVDWSVNLPTLGGDPVGAVSAIVNNGIPYNCKEMTTSTPQRHPSHGPDNSRPNKFAARRIKGLICRVPIMNDYGELVPMWANVPAINGDIFHPAARIYHELSDAELNRIKAYNIMMSRHVKFLNILNQTTKSLNVSGLVDAPEAVQNHLKRYPKARNINLNSVARVEQRRQKMIET